MLSLLLVTLAWMTQGYMQAGMPPSAPMINISATGNGWIAPGASFKVLDGDFARFNVYMVSGDLPKSYQWYKNGIAIGGATEAIYEIDYLQFGDTGAYHVVVSNPYGFIAGPTNTMLVAARPAITQSPAGSVLLDGTTTLTATAPTNYPLTMPQWNFNGKPIAGETNGSLNLTHLKFADDGEYVYKVDYQNFFGPGMTRYGVESAPYRLRVYAAYAAPIVVTQPKNQIGRLGGFAVFTVGASGTQPFTYTWRKNGVPIPGGTDFFLCISNLSPGEVGNYSVMVSNISGGATSQVATLSLGAPPPSNPGADALVTSGRSSLGSQNNTGLQAARSVFGSATTMMPEHELANLFEGITRIVNIVNKPSVQTLLDRLLISKQGRDPYQCTATLAYDGEGNVETPNNFSVNDLAGALRDSALPDVRAALTNFTYLLTPAFQAQLTATETMTSDVTVDQADLWITRAMLYGAEYGMRTLNSWNLDTELSHLKSLYVTNGELTMQRLMLECPQLFTFSDVSQIAPARLALENAVDAYVQGIGMAKSRPSGSLRLFNLEAKSLENEERFRQLLLDVKASLATAITVNEQPQLKLNWGAVSDGSQSWRSLLPGFSGNFPNPGTLPSATFGGLARSEGMPLILCQPMAQRFYAGNSLTVGVIAAGKAPLSFQWQKNGLSLPNATNSTLVLPNAYANEQGDYQVIITNIFGVVTSQTANVSFPRYALANWGDFMDNGYPVVGYHRAHVPQGVDDIVAMACAPNFDLAASANKKVTYWGYNYYGNSGYPMPLLSFVNSLSNLTQIDIGPDYNSTHIMTLTLNGQVSEWWSSSSYIIPPGLSGVRAIAAGNTHSLALKQDGTVIGWGAIDYKQSIVPTGLVGVAAIDAGPDYSLALKSNGTVVAWGNNNSEQYLPPVGLSDAVAIAAGITHRLALKADGRVVQWGSLPTWPFGFNVDPPPNLSNIVAIAAYGNASFAMKSDGSIVAWGDTNAFWDFELSGNTGICPISGIPGLTTISAGNSHGMVMSPLLIKNPPRDQQVAEGGKAVLEVYTASAAEPVNYQWMYNGVPVQGATTPMLVISNAQSSSAGNYSVRVSNAGYLLTSRTAKLRITPLNDTFAAAKLIPGGGGHLLGSTTAASKDSGEPYHAGNAGGHSLWFVWQAPANSVVIIDTIGSSFDTLLAVYKGATVSNLTLVAADDDGAGFNSNSRLTFTATAGTTYYIAVDGYNGDSGGVSLNLTPQVTISGLVRTSGNQFNFIMSAPAQSNVVVEASSDLKGWTPITTNTSPDAGLINVSDSTANQTNRFYRALVK